MLSARSVLSIPPMLSVHIQVKSGSFTLGHLMFEAPCSDVRVLDLQVKDLKNIVSVHSGMLAEGQAWFLRASRTSFLMQSLDGNEFLFELGPGGVRRFIRSNPPDRGRDVDLHFIVQCNADLQINGLLSFEEFMDLPALLQSMQSMQSEPSAMGPQEVNAVSYTHLTLPTNREV